MNRPIKFRAWAKSRMLEWEDLIMKSWGFEHYLNNPDFEVMQFTGLLDENSKEIYESDLMKLPSGDTVDKVLTLTTRGI